MCHQKKVPKAILRSREFLSNDLLGIESTLHIAFHVLPASMVQRVLAALKEFRCAFYVRATLSRRAWLSAIGIVI